MAEEPSKIEIDFDDDRGYRPVRFDEPVRIVYDEHFASFIRVRMEHGGFELVSCFQFETVAAAPLPDEVWPLMAVEQYGVRPKATGTAWVYYANGRRRIEEPFIFADGFGKGATSLDEVWRLMNESGYPFVDELRRRGKDLIILGYADKTAYIQENAFVAVDCIEKAIAKRSGGKKLVTGGGDMGGLVTRYALAWMETKKRDHQTATYLSYDAPHNGAWVPLMAQWAAHFYGNNKKPDPRAQEFSQLINSPAAQELLFAHVATWDQGGVVDSNPLRVKMIEELNAMGWFPQVPRKLGVANGRGDGKGNGVPEGAVNINYKFPCHGGEMLTSPPFKDVPQYVGTLWEGRLRTITYMLKGFPVFDAAPGGTSTFYKWMADALQVPVTYPTTCFVPTVSALSIPADLYVDVSTSTHLSAFDDCTWDKKEHGAHVRITSELATWILDRIAAKTEATPAEASLATVG